MRASINFKRLSLTDIAIEIPRMPKKKQLADAIEAAGSVLILKCFVCLIIHCVDQFTFLYILEEFQ